MKLDELIKEYNLLIDEEGLYYRTEKNVRTELHITLDAFAAIFNLSYGTINHRLKKAQIAPQRVLSNSTRYSAIVKKVYNLNDLIQVCRDMFVPCPIVDKKGFAHIGGKKYTSLRTLSTLFNIGTISIRLRIKKHGLIPQKIKLQNGDVIDGYAYCEAQKACLDLLQDLPLAGDDNIAYLDGQQYAAIGKIKDILGLSYGTIFSRVKQHSLQSIQIILKSGVLREAYSIEPIRKCCDNLLREIPMINDENIALVDGREYATLPTIAKLFGTSTTTIRKKVEALSPQPIRLRNGQLRDGYELEVVKTVCTNLIQDLPKMGRDSATIIEGKEYFPITALSRIIGISSQAIMPRIEHLKPARIKTKSGKVVDAYPFEEVKEACSDLLQTLPILAKGGIAIIGTEKYATIPTISKLLKLSGPTLLRRIAQHKLKAVTVKSSSGPVRKAYNIESVKLACQDILKDYYLADQDGVVNMAGKKYSTLKHAQRLFGLKDDTLKKRAEKENLQSIKIKISTGVVTEGYDLEELAKACADLLQDIPQIGNDGFVTIEGKKYAPITTLGKPLGISGPGIAVRIKGLIPIRVKTRAYHITDAYALDEVRAVCADLIAKKRRRSKPRFKPR